jgi:hypothetical protein
MNMFDDVDKSARMAIEANVKIPLHKRAWRGIKTWYGGLPPIVTVFFSIFALAALLGISSWEALNSARGWVLLGKGSAPMPLAFIAGVCVTVGYIVFHRRASERARLVNDLTQEGADGFVIQRARTAANKALVTAVILAALSLGGVFSNLASKSGMAANEAGEVNSSRTQVMARVISLQNDLDNANPELIAALISANESKLASMTAEAMGWGMADLLPDKGCAQDLMQRQRQLCNAANGSVDQTGTVGQLAALRADMDGYNAKLEKLKSAQALLDTVHAVEGQEHWDSMTALTAGKVGADQFRIWGMFLASVLFLFGAGNGWDELFEQREKRKKV